MSDRPARLSRRAKHVAALGSIALIILGAVLSPVVQDLYDRITSGPDVGEQLDDLLNEQAQQSRHAVYREQAHLHGSGPNSQVFVFRRSGGLEKKSEHSDEIQIYDRDGSDLEQAFRFRPRITVPGAPEQNDNVAFEVSVAHIHDYANDGRSEIVGTVGAASELDPLVLPFAIGWDDADQEYSLYALFRKAPQWGQATGLGANRLHARLTSPVRVLDTEDESSGAIRGFLVDDFEIVESEQLDGPIFLTSAVATTGGIADLTQELELKGWRPDADPILTPAQCYPFELQPGTRPYVVSADKTLVEAWEERPRIRIEC
jgi:hypothetical protein